MDVQITLLGVLICLIITIYLVIKKCPPAYAMMAGALAGGIVGGVGTAQTVKYMIDGSQMMIPAILRVLAAGVFAGTLIQSGATETIAKTIVEKLGSKNALIAIAISTWLLTVVGVFIVVSILMVVPIAIAIAKQANLSRTAILIAMIGGGKAGNIMSPSPSGISAADIFEIPLSSVIYVGIIPAMVGLLVTFLIARMLSKRGSAIGPYETVSHETNPPQTLPSFGRSIIGPVSVIVILVLQPLLKVTIDPVVVLPLCGLIGSFAMERMADFIDFMRIGLANMVGVSILLVGTGTLAGIISHSDLKDVMFLGFQTFNTPGYLIAPVSGGIMSLATGTSTVATVLAGNIFGETLLELGIQAISGAAMIHASSVAFDHFPHSPFFMLHKQV